MKDKDEIKEQLINELVKLRQRIAELESSEAERKQMEEALKESENKYRTLFESSVDGILITDIETQSFKYAHPAMCRLLGYSEIEIQGIRISEIHPKDRLNYAISEFEAHAKGEKTLSENLPFLKTDGTIVYTDITGTTSMIAGRHCSVAFLRDITKRMRAEQERKALIEELQEALNKVKTLSGLIPICSSCKNIRDDKGFWNQVVAYVENHSEAEFTHGFCPECMKKFYPNLVTNKEKHEHHCKHRTSMLMETGAYLIKWSR